MTERKQIYRCNICGNIVMVLHAGKGQLVCCGQPMELLQERTEEMGKEKHVPILETVEGGTRVKVGSVPHPMEEKHHIEWVEVEGEGLLCLKFLQPGEAPEAEFRVRATKAREYCNIHGLWKGE
ncbi:MAG: desulfoferrodoxin [Hadesarchaea archaeon]|nr:MAG: desulfoferrodoxin [Hadesarchaea archaeon]TDA31208.1 MAG: desulfoferrodoxin [Hadesarchaea archaeon]